MYWVFLKNHLVRGVSMKKYFLVLVILSLLFVGCTRPVLTPTESPISPIGPEAMYTIYNSGFSTNPQTQCLWTPDGGVVLNPSSCSPARFNDSADWTTRTQDISVYPGSTVNVAVNIGSGEQGEFTKWTVTVGMRRGGGGVVWDQCQVTAYSGTGSTYYCTFTAPVSSYGYLKVRADRNFGSSDLVVNVVALWYYH